MKKKTVFIFLVILLAALVVVLLASRRKTGPVSEPVINPAPEIVLGQNSSEPAEAQSESSGNLSPDQKPVQKGSGQNGTAVSNPGSKESLEKAESAQGVVELPDIELSDSQAREKTDSVTQQTEPSPDPQPTSPLSQLGTGGELELPDDPLN